MRLDDLQASLFIPNLMKSTITFFVQQDHFLYNIQVSKNEKQFCLKKCFSLVFGCFRRFLRNFKLFFQFIFQFSILFPMNLQQVTFFVQQDNFLYNTQVETHA